MTDQIADARPPTRAEHETHSNLLLGLAIAEARRGFLDTRDACLAGLAALDEAATLRAERDRLIEANVRMRAAFKESSTDTERALRARVVRLEAALRAIPIHDDDVELEALRTAALTPPASTEPFYCAKCGSGTRAGCDCGGMA
jgi:hypothetical protein